MNHQIVLDIPADALLALKGSSEEAGNELRMAAAVKLYELGRISSEERGCKEIFVSKRENYDLRDRDAIIRMYQDSKRT